MEPARNKGDIMAYHLEGRLLEVCDCRVLCPCWIGEDPDNGTCESMQAWHFDKGTIDGIDVSGRTIAAAFHIPGNVLKGGFRAAIYIDDGASDQQQEAILEVYAGKRGGPVAELAKLIGEVVSIERVPITFAVNEGRGTLRIADAGFAELAPIAQRPLFCGRSRDSRILLGNRRHRPNEIARRDRYFAMYKRRRVPPSPRCSAQPPHFLVLVL
jgi:hypothetical protein